MKIHTFTRGGLMYRDDTAPQGASSRIAFLPTIAVLPMLQHSGTPASPVVFCGDTIKEGMVVGRSEGKESAVIHASIPGKVVKNVVWRMPDGKDSSALVVKLEGSFEKLGKRRELFSWNGMSSADLQRTITEKGVVEMENRGRSVADLLSKARNSNVKTLIVVNAVFDDEWLAAERAVLAERAEAVAEGVEIVMKVSSGSALVLSVSKEHQMLATPILDFLSARGIHASLAVLSSKYPQRNIRELEIALRSFYKGSATEFDNVLPFGMSTLAAVHDAVRFNMPLIERYVAIGGDVVKHPAVLRVRIGTRIGDAIAECGGFIEEPSRIIIGSPLTGRSVYDLDSPITKTTSAVVAVSRRKMGGTTVRACVGCGNCRSVCPVGLDPERLHKLIMLGRYEEATDEGAASCHGCACCAAVCPSRLPLRASILLSADKGGRS
ncbi:MAG: SLBB domain-containing protein [Treponemataceae bacterium]